MNGDIFIKTDFLQRTGIAEGDLDVWLKEKIIRPSGYTDDKEPLFGSDAVERVTSVRKLIELGYGLPDIQKIMKKVGLPNGGSGKKEGPEKVRFFTVGRLAERSGVSPRTIKHWEDKGIIEPDMRSEGGFRLYSEPYVYLCLLIRDLQLFGYTLDEIKAVSDDVRSLMAMEAGPGAFPKDAVERRLGAMLGQIQALFLKMKLLGEGIERWEGLLKKKKKDILALQARNMKRPDPPPGDSDA